MTVRRSDAARPLSLPFRCLCTALAPPSTALHTALTCVRLCLSVGEQRGQLRDKMDVLQSRALLPNLRAVNSAIQHPPLQFSCAARPDQRLPRSTLECF